MLNFPIWRLLHWEPQGFTALGFSEAVLGLCLFLTTNGAGGVAVLDLCGLACH